MQIQAGEGQHINQPRAYQNCWQRVVSRCRTYCYLDPQQDMTPTYWQRTKSAVGGFFTGAFVGGITAGVIATIADICQRSGITVDQDLLLKILISAIGTPPVVSFFNGALHPPRRMLLRDQLLRPQ